MHSGNGGVESEYMSMDVRSSPGGALTRLRCKFEPLVGVSASAPDTLMPGFDRRDCPDCPDASGWACEVTARPLGRRFLFFDDMREDAGEGPADAVRSGWGRRVAVSGSEVTEAEGIVCGSSTFEPLGLCRRRRSAVGRCSLLTPVSSLPEESPRVFDP